MEKPAPLAVACEIVTVDPPVLVKVSDLLLLLPTWILPKARLEGLGVRVPAESPVPEKLSTTVLFFCFPFFSSAVIANETLPLKFPLPVGANVIAVEVPFPACTVSGRARLLIENPAPLIVADVTVRSVPPLFARATAVTWWPPTLVWPKGIGEGLGESSPIVTALPEADRETIGCCELCPSKAIVVAGLPGSVGLNWTLNGVLCPTANTIGSAMPVT